MCVSGLTGIQRNMLQSKSLKLKSEWMTKGTLNNLADVYEFYCKKGKLEKAVRDMFVNGSMDEIRENFQVTFGLYHTHEMIRYLFLQVSCNGLLKTSEKSVTDSGYAYITL